MLGGKRHFRRVNKFSLYALIRILSKANIEMCIHVPVQRGAVHGSSGKISLEWYSSRSQVILWANNDCENSLGCSCASLNQNPFCCLRQSGERKNSPEEVFNICSIALFACTNKCKCRILKTYSWEIIPNWSKWSISSEQISVPNHPAIIGCTCILG